MGTLTRMTRQLSAVAIIAVMLSASMLAVPLDDQQAQVADTSDAITLTDAYNSLFSSIILAFLIGYNMPHDRPLASNDAESAAENVTDVLQALTASGIINSDLGTFSQSYFNRMAEVAASEVWSAGSTMDADTILSDSTAADNMAVLAQDVANAVSSPFGYAHDSKQLSFGFTWASTTIGAKVMTEDSKGARLYYGLGCTVTSSSADRVYLYAGDTENYSALYVSGGATITGTDGKTYALAEGYNSLSALGINSGYYQLAAGHTYIGTMADSGASDAATLLPAVVLSGSTALAYVTMPADGQYSVVYNGAAATATNLTYNIKDSDSTAAVQIAAGLSILSSIHATCRAIESKAITSAQAAWKVYDTAGKSSSLVSPSALIPNLKDLDFTSDQVYLIYMSALDQMSAYYETASGNFSAEDVIISQDSLQLICHGTIYSDSTKTAARATDVYFTPMCYLRDQAVVIGDTAFMQPGLAMLWNKTTAGFQASGLVVLESGNYLSIDSLEYKGQSYATAGDGVTLHVTKLTETNGYKSSEHKDTPNPETNWAKLILYIAGAILIVGGLITQRIDLILCGVACLLVAWLAGAWIWTAVKKLGIIKAVLL